MSATTRNESAAERRKLRKGEDAATLGLAFVLALGSWLPPPDWLSWTVIAVTLYLLARRVIQSLDAPRWQAIVDHHAALAHEPGGAA